MNDLIQNNYMKVLAGLVIGLMAIIYFNPPHTACQSQIDVYVEAIKPLSKPFAKAMKMCREHTEPGGCVEFFEILGRLETKFKSVSKSCQTELARDTVTRNWLTAGMEMSVRVAWGSKPPQSANFKNGWLELSQLTQYCRLRFDLENLYGKDTWAGFANGLLNDLPGAAQLGRTEAWNRSILSDPCRYAL